MLQRRHSLPNLVIGLAAAALIAGQALAQNATDGRANVFANACLRYVVGEDGKNLAFVDLASGKDYLRAEPASHIARAKLAGEWHDAARVASQGEAVRVGFAGTDATATIKMAAHDRHLVFEVTDASGAIEELQLLNLQLTLQGRLEEPFAACALALNLKTNVGEIPGPNSRLAASCVSKFGLVGAAVAVIACPTGQMRDALKEAIDAAPEMPKSPLGGPWAMDAPINRASYLFAAPSEQNVDEIIRTVKSIGFNQVQIHGGRGTYRFGDCLPNPQLYPNGVASVKAVIDRLHEADIYVGMHPYAFFIDKATPWVTPVPNPGLASDATFTLAADLPVDANSVPVTEPTGTMHTITGFFVRNSVTLRIGEELITYGGVSKEPPYAFTQCTRGALGTKASAHSAGEKVYHLKECFGLFLPDPDSDLFFEVVQTNADFFNACGFDTIYQDALDGEDTLGGSAESWHYGSKYVWELWKRLDRPAAMEYSTFHHHLWPLRSRIGAWDHPTRSYKQFIDQHVAGNRNNDRMFLPSQLGWWAFKNWQPPQGEPTFPDDIEYWCAKALGTDSGLSLMGYNPALPGHQRLAEIVKRYEELRHTGHFPESVKARLREPGVDFSLEQGPDGQWQFRPAKVEKHTVQGPDGWSDKWTVQNPYSEQAPSLRVEAMMAAAPHDSPEGINLAEFTSPDEFGARNSAPTVKADLECIMDGDVAYGRLTATNSGKERRGTWASFRKTFDPPLNLGNRQAMGVWVLGDGKGEVLNLQVESPSHISHGKGEHYVTVDFEGWRYIELIEHDSDRYADYAWPYPGGYSIYREHVNYSVISALTIWCNNLPPEDSILVDLRPVRALPLVTTRVITPSLSINGQTVTFPVEIASGQYIEVDASGKGNLHGPAGEPLGEVDASGSMPKLDPGDNALTFSSSGPQSPAPRARVTTFARGEAFR